MEIKLIKKLAKNINTNSDELSFLVGVDVIIDRLLARHPNTTKEMLEQLSRSDDKTVCRSSVTHPNIGRDTLVKLARKYTKAFFKSPALEEILSKYPSIPMSLERECLRNILNSKNCSDTLGKWALEHGDDWLQASYILGKDRQIYMLEKYRKSKYPQVVSAILHFDDTSYLQWAKDLGYEISVHEGEESAFLSRSYAELYIDQLNDLGSSLYQKLVPDRGAAESLQGELLRAIGALEAEYLRNLFMNWGDGSNYYEDFLALIYNTLIQDKSFSPLVKSIIEADVEHIRFIAQDESDEDNPFRFNDIEAMAFPRLNAVIVVWCNLHPDFIHLNP